MKKFIKVLGVLGAIIVLAVVTNIALTPWMDRWGASADEIAGSFPADQLVPAPASVVNRAISINASPEQIYPWLVQIGAGKAGWYSHAWLENMIQCPIVNADRIHAEWQDLKVGDEVKMCPGEFAPPPYTVAMLNPGQMMVLGHQENGKWVEEWQFNIVAQPDGTSRLVLRTRTMMTGGFWDVIHPGVFLMETGMLSGIKERAEAAAKQ